MYYKNENDTIITEQNRTRTAGKKDNNNNNNKTKQVSVTERNTKDQKRLLQTTIWQ